MASVVFFFCSKWSYSLASLPGVQHFISTKRLKHLWQFKWLPPLTLKSTMFLYKSALYVFVGLAMGSHKVEQVIFSPLEMQYDRKFQIFRKWGYCQLWTLKYSMGQRVLFVFSFALKFLNFSFSVVRRSRKFIPFHLVFTSTSWKRNWDYLRILFGMKG